MAGGWGGVYSVGVAKEHTMRALGIYLAITAVAVNVVANAMANSAEGLKRASEQRTERLCQINPVYCD